MVKDAHHADHPATFANEVNDECVIVIRVSLTVLAIIKRGPHQSMVIAPDS